MESGNDQEKLLANGGEEEKVVMVVRDEEANV